MSDDVIETEFELNEQIFVPAGDGKAAKWMRKADLHVDEMERYVQGLTAGIDQQRERLVRVGALIDKAKQKCGGRHGVPFGDLLSPEEIAEMTMLEMATAATDRSYARRKAAIDKDIAAGRYHVLRLGKPS